MSFSPVFQHRAAIGEPDAISPVFQHRAGAGTPSSFSPTFQHRFSGGSASSFSPVFQHIAEFDSLGKIRGEQLESPLTLPRALDILEGGETNAPDGCVRYYNEGEEPRWVNSKGIKFSFDLVIPIGAVIPWWPLQGADVPNGFELCDGTAVSTNGSPYFGQFKPGLMKSDAAPGATQRFMRGADASVDFGSPVPLVNGGSDAHTHDGTTNADGDHAHGAGPHVHVIAAEPNHNHGPTLEGITDGAQFLGALGSSERLVESVTDGSKEHHSHLIGLDGAHDHTGQTIEGIGDTDTAGDHDHDFTSSSSANAPAFVELAFIVRVI